MWRRTAASNRHSSRRGHTRPEGGLRSAMPRNVRVRGERQDREQQKPLQLLDIRRVAAASLCVAGHGGMDVRATNASEMVWTDTPLPLVVAPPPIDPAVLADMVRRVRELEAKLIRLRTLKNWRIRSEDPAKQLEGQKIGGVYSVVSVDIDNPPGDQFIRTAVRTEPPNSSAGDIGRTVDGARGHVKNIAEAQVGELRGRQAVIDGNRLKLHLKDSGAPGSSNAAFVVHVCPT